MTRLLTRRECGTPPQGVKVVIDQSVVEKAPGDGEIVSLRAERHRGYHTNPN